MENKMANGNYTVVVDGQKFNVTIAEGNANIQVASCCKQHQQLQPSSAAVATSTSCSSNTCMFGDSQYQQQ